MFAWLSVIGFFFLFFFFQILVYCLSGPIIGLIGRTRALVTMKLNARNNAAIDQAPPFSIASLPLELQYMILDSLSPGDEWPDKAALAACASTQRCWRHAAVNSLYSRIEILGKKQYALFENTFCNNKSLASKTQVLSVLDVTPGERISTTVFHSPRRLNLTGLEQLYVLFGAPDDSKQITTFPFHRSFLATLRQFRSMHHIYFYHFELESLDEMRKTLGSLPNLESAVFCNVTWKKPYTEFKPLFNATSRRLLRFSLSDCTSDFIAPFFWGPPPPSLREPQPLGSSPPVICREEVLSLTQLATLVLSPTDSTAQSICWQWEQAKETSEWCLLCGIEHVDLPRNLTCLRIYFGRLGCDLSASVKGPVISIKSEKRMANTFVEGRVTSIDILRDKQAGLEMTTLDACLGELHFLNRLNWVFGPPVKNPSVQLVVPQQPGVLASRPKRSIGGGKTDDVTSVFPAGSESRAAVACCPKIEVQRADSQKLVSQSLHRLTLALEKLLNPLRTSSQHDAALLVIQRIVLIKEVLAKDQPAAFNRDLANSLNILYICLNNLGQYEDALVVIQRGVSICEVLASDRPAAFNQYLAGSLNNLYTCLYKLGRHEEALVAIQRAVSMYEVLAHDQPAAFDQHLATSLINLSVCLDKLGRHNAAFVPIQRAVSMYEVLAHDRPATFNQNLAMSLNNLYVCLFDLGRHEEALAVIRRAISIYEVLASDRPAAFNQYLAMSLNNLHNCLFSLGRHGGALDAIRRAVSIREALAHDRPAAFNQDLADSLYNLSCQYSHLDRHGDALEPVERSLALYRELMQTRPLVVKQNVINALGALSSCLTALGRNDEAAEAHKEAEELRTQAS